MRFITLVLEKYFLTEHIYEQIEFGINLKLFLMMNSLGKFQRKN